jgi:hypothetical protein
LSGGFWGIVADFALKFENINVVLFALDANQRDFFQSPLLLIL